MKHSVEELTAIAYQYFPRGMSSSERLYTETVEYRRRLTARARASAEYEPWREMLRRIQARFPQELHPGVMVENRSIFLQSPTAGPADRCFSGALWLPVCGLEKNQHQLAFLISFVVPYYVVHSSILVEHPSAPDDGREMFFEIIGDTFYAYGEQSPERPNAKKYEAPKVTTKQEISFRLSEEEALFARGLVEEIEAAFPGHLPMPPEVGRRILPDVSDDRHELGETTLFDCLFTDQR